MRSCLTPIASLSGSSPGLFQTGLGMKLPFSDPSSTIVTHSASFTGITGVCEGLHGKHFGSSNCYQNVSRAGFHRLQYMNAYSIQIWRGEQSNDSCMDRGVEGLGEQRALLVVCTCRDGTLKNHTMLSVMRWSSRSWCKCFSRILLIIGRRHMDRRQYNLCSGAPALVLIPCISGFNLLLCTECNLNVQDFLTSIILRWYFTQTPWPS